MRVLDDRDSRGALGPVRPMARLLLALEEALAAELEPTQHAELESLAH